MLRIIKCKPNTINNLKFYIKDTSNNEIYNEEDSSWSAIKKFKQKNFRNGFLFIVNEAKLIIKKDLYCLLK